jgi:hypothetical protein
MKKERQQTKEKLTSLLIWLIESLYNTQRLEKDKQKGISSKVFKAKAKRCKVNLALQSHLRTVGIIENHRVILRSGRSEYRIRLTESIVKSIIALPKTKHAKIDINVKTFLEPSSLRTLCLELSTKTIRFYNATHKKNSDKRKGSKKKDLEFKFVRDYKLSEPQEPKAITKLKKSKTHETNESLVNIALRGATIGGHLLVAKSLADLYYGGHFTLLSFTTHVKFGFGTITDRDAIDEMSDYDSIEDAIENAIQQHFARQINHSSALHNAIAKSVLELPTIQDTIT